MRPLLLDNSSDLAEVRKKSLDLLSRRGHSRHELERKLLSRSFDVDVITETLDWLEKQGWLNDKQFCADYLQQRSAKGVGPLKLASELIRKGIDRSLIKHSIKQLDIDWKKMANQVVNSKYTLDDLEQREKARITRFLSSRGFTGDQIFSVFKDD